MRILLLLLALSGCATPQSCERWAEAQDGYGDDVMENILHRDNLIRECLGMQPSHENRHGLMNRSE